MRFTGRVAISRPLTTGTHAIEVEKPAAFSFRPTQFTWLQIETPQGWDVRPMSLATSPTRPRLEYAVRLSDSAYKRAFAALRKGDRIGVAGPVGDFVLDETRPAVLVAGGIGITPLKGMAEYAADVGMSIPIRLLYSSRSKEEIVYKSELEALARKNPEFHVLHTLTQEPMGGPWRGRTGRIDSVLLGDAARGLDDPVYYVCGKPAMVEAVLDQLEALDVSEGDVRVEAFHGY